MDEQEKGIAELTRKISRLRDLEDVADAARALVSQWQAEDSNGQPLDWLIKVLADTLDILDEPYVGDNECDT